MDKKEYAINPNLNTECPNCNHVFKYNYTNFSIHKTLTCPNCNKLFTLAAKNIPDINKANKAVEDKLAKIKSGKIHIEQSERKKLEDYLKKVAIAKNKNMK